MYRSATLSDLYVLHTGGSDPHHNYTLGTETYTGAINKRPVVVHSLYLDDPENPRNVKTYDSTNQATITDILIDNVLPGDEIGLKQQTMTGTYATAQAGETLTADGKTQKDRLKKLNGKLDARLRAKAEHLIARLKLDAEAAASVTDVLRQYMPANPKGIVFTDDIAAIEEARGLMNEAFPDMSCYTIHSKQSKEKNEAQLAAFMQAPTACIISVNMLGEGVHVDGVNFIVMLRRTQSPTVYFQQIGRCTKVGSDGEPVIFDIVGNRCTLRMIEVKKAEFLGLSRRAGEKKGGQFVLSSYLEDGLRVLDEIDELLNQWRPWSVEEDEIIRKFYPSEGLETCSRLSNRTKNSVRDRACFLGIARSNYYWKKEEDDILRKYHPKEGTTVCSRLPGRTRNAIKARLATLGIVAPNNRWTKEEDNILQEYYPIEGLAACSRLPGRTRAATQQRAVNLGLTMSSRWTEEEDNILREQYPIEGMAVCSRLPGRSRNSVMQRVFRLNLTVSSRWTKEEDDILRTHYPKEGVAVCSRIPGRTKEATVVAQAERLGMSYGKYRAMQAISAASIHAKTT